MTQSISNMSQVWLSNTNTYNSIAMSISTLGAGANAGSRLLTFKVDGNTKFDIDTSGDVDISGNVGIGKKSSFARLDVAGFSLFGNYGDQYQGFSLQNNANSAASLTVNFIDFRNDLYIPDAHIFSLHETNGGSRLYFGTTPPGSRASDRRLDRLVITPDGKIGINTYTPGARFEVYGPSAGTIAQFIGLTDTFQGIAVAAADASASAYRGVYFDARNESYATVANFAVDINTDGSSSWVWGVQTSGTRTDRRYEAMRLDSSGNLRINSGYGSAANAYAVRAWVSFNGNDGSIFASRGVTSVTRNTNGVYTINFNFTMPDANYAVSGSGMETNGLNSGGSYQSAFSLGSSTSTTTTTCQIQNANVDGGNNVDGARITFMAVR